MKAIILAGGMARRLKPVTDDLPKCLLNVGGKTIIDRQLESLFREGAEEVLVVTGFKSELLEQHIELHHPGKPIRTIKNEAYETTGPAYGLWCAKDYLGESETLYLNGDLVCDHAVIQDLITNNKSSLTAVSRNAWDEEQVKVGVNPDRSVKALGKWVKAPESYGEFVGATKMSKEFGRALKHTLEQAHQDGSLQNKFAADTLHETITEARETMYIYDVTNYKTIEIDTIADFQAATRLWRLGAVSKVQTLAKILAAHLIHALSCLMPRARKKIVFIGWHGTKEHEIFADNSKYLFLHVHNNLKESVRPIWIARDTKLAEKLSAQGLEAHYTYSAAGIWHALTAKYTIVDAHMYRDNWQFSGRSKIIQLWHGKGMKKSSLPQRSSARFIDKFMFPEVRQTFSLVIASSEYTAALMAEIFSAPRERVMVTGLPRNDMLFRDITGAGIDLDEQYEQAVAEFKKEGAEKIIAYMPTFRRNSSNPLDQLDLEKLNSALEKQNARMIITLHPKFAATHYHASSELKNIRIFGAGYDVYPLFKDIDMLVTDYSSIYVDYLLLNRPIIFYTYDRERYEQEEGLYEDFDDLTPGPHVATFDELLEAIHSYKDSDWAGARKTATDTLHTFKDGGASERVMKSLLT